VGEYYRLLDDLTAEPTDSVLEAAASVGTVLERSIVGWVEVVTFFLGVDCGGDDGLLLWETVLRRFGEDAPIARYSHANLAVKGHDRIVMWALPNTREIYAGVLDQESLDEAMEGLNL